MLLYISSNENIGIFDFLSNEHGMVIKNLSGSFSLNQFVIHDMRSLNHYSYFAIDLKALKDTEDEIIEAIIAFKSMFSSRVILYIEDIKNNERLIEQLIEHGIYNIISADTVDDLKEEIQRTISDIGISKRDIKLKLNKTYGTENCYIPEYYFENKDIKIAVTGVSHKVGTTTIAMNLCNYLAGIGASVCYIEANNNGHIQKLPSVYLGMTVKSDCIIYNGVKYLSLNSHSDEEYHFVIYDMGVIERKTIKAIKNNFDVSITCATAKPYEIGAYDKAIDLLDDVRVHTIFSFVQDNAKTKLQEQYGNVLFSEYTPDLFDSEKNKDIWDQILDKYITKNTI
ncbi:hypothetical protein IZY60_03500 [Lutibacter sp. B2]|nr:hypothetical protein [Lutibacter sp. B2]